MAKKIGAKKSASPPATKPREQEIETDEGSDEAAAAAFDNTKAQGQVEGGKYEALLADMVLQPKNDQGQSVRAEYEIADEGDYRGVKVAQFYKIIEANGDAGKGAAFLKKDLVVLGFPDVSYGALKECFEEIKDKELAVHVTIKQNGAYTNVYLNGLAEGSDVVAEYMTTRAF